MSLYDAASPPIAGPGRLRAGRTARLRAMRQGLRAARIGAALTAHLILLQRTGQLRFRAETFGVYYPALPYERSPWRISPAYAIALARQALDYGAWLVEMDDLTRHGARGWWGPRVVAWKGIDDEQ